LVENTAWLTNLGRSLLQRYITFSREEDLDEAISKLRDAVNTYPTTVRVHPSSLNDLVMALLQRFELLSSPDDFNEVIAILHRITGDQDLPKDHPNLPIYLHNLGISYNCHWTKNGKVRSDFDLAISAYRRSNDALGDNLIRFRSAKAWADLAHTQGDLSLAMEGYSRAISLLPQLSWLGMSIEARQYNLLTEATNMTQNAVACAIKSCNYERAVEFLDHGRSVFWSQAADLRPDLAFLDSVDAGLGAEIRRASEALHAGTFEDPLRGKTTDINLNETAEKHRRLVAAWELLVDRVRQIESMEHFLRATPYSELQQAAVGGPVIVINVSSYGCDALVIKAGVSIERVSLDNLTYAATTQQADRFRVGLARVGETDNSFERHFLQPILQKLWTAVAFPILAKLGHTTACRDVHSKPRVWWCPTGPLTFLPIHAAGPYKRGGGPDVNQCVVSSYTSTLAALVRARKRTNSRQTKMVTVGLAETPGHRPLPDASTEVELICQRGFQRGLPFSRLEGANATTDAVLTALSTHTCAHFTCHGHQDHHRPTDTALQLHDGPLRLSTIASRRLDHADFAFLSACHTGRGADSYPDEAMHVAGGLYFAGFRGVIATMWALGDDTGPAMAELFYMHESDN
jgi:tetratricopeptide (TPR) repeat protein